MIDSPIQNTFALWDVHALTDHGGFDADNGVEEVAPIIRQLREDLQSVALMEGPPGARLNIRKTGDGQTRHTEVRETKLARQHDEASKLGVPLAFIAENLIHL